MIFFRIHACGLHVSPTLACCQSQRVHLQVSNYSSLVQWPQGPNACMRKKAHVDSGTLTILASDDWLSGHWQARTHHILAAELHTSTSSVRNDLLAVHAVNALWGMVVSM